MRYQHIQYNFQKSQLNKRVVIAKLWDNDRMADFGTLVMRTEAAGKTEDRDL